LQKQTTITSKGQVTVPHEIRRILGVQSGDRLVFESDEKGVRVRPVRTKSQFAKYRGIGNPSIPSGGEGINRWTRETRGIRETVQARVRRDAAFRKGLLRDAVESLLAEEVSLGKELLRDYINATVGFPKLAEETKLHVKTLHQIFGPRGNPTASNLFEIVAYLQRQEAVRLQVRTSRAVA